MIFRDFWKTRSFKNFLFHPCEEQKNKLKNKNIERKEKLGQFTWPRISCKFKSSDGMRSWTGILLKSKVGGSSVQEEVEPWLKVKRKHCFILLNFQQVRILLTILLLCRLDSVKLLLSLLLLHWILLKNQQAIFTIQY